MSLLLTSLINGVVNVCEVDRTVNTLTPVALICSYAVCYRHMLAVIIKCVFMHVCRCLHDSVLFNTCSLNACSMTALLFLLCLLYNAIKHKKHPEVFILKTTTIFC